MRVKDSQDFSLKDRDPVEFLAELDEREIARRVVVVGKFDQLFRLRIIQAVNVCMCFDETAGDRFRRLARGWRQEILDALREGGASR